MRQNSTSFDAAFNPACHTNSEFLTSDSAECEIGLNVGWGSDLGLADWRRRNPFPIWWENLWGISHFPERGLFLKTYPLKSDLRVKSQS